MSVFIHQQSLDADLARWLSCPLTTRYKKQQIDEVDTKTISIEVVLQGDSSFNWHAMPHHGRPEFLPPAARISAAIQGALRTWLPYVWFANIENFDDYDTAAALLMYSCSRVYIAKTKQAFNFDFMDDRTPGAMQFSIENGLPKRLGGIELILRKHKRRCASWYSARQAGEMLALLSRCRHDFNSILVAERELVEGYLSLGDPTRSAAGRLRIQRTLRKLFRKKDFSFLAGVFEWEATHAAARKLGTEHEFEAKIFANSRLLPPLDPHEDNSVIPCSDTALPLAA